MVMLYFNYGDDGDDYKNDIVYDNNDHLHRIFMYSMSYGRHR